ncbi:sodium:solute symporter family protein [Bifidobacterium platyrrhinorum]|uniref:Sodium/solute symporter n=1 Tax=Bifidobacterium platyrrhinorum TaxID=2661628 RepID=A0A6L9SVG8_9BIFI|nr:sodium:solute symporter family protein [Bifidobacterium platyrrhinorum]NEG55853.1 sodium/solute symporter [Bifidobacterium platyrrhinorum]
MPTTVLAAAESSIKLSLQPIDYAILVFYFVVVIAIGWISGRRMKSSTDFLLAGRSMPAWITGIAFMAANLGATEIFGMAANGAQIGMSTLHYYIIGAIPAMVFLGIFMMPFYYGSGVRSVPEFMYRRFGKSAHLVCSLCFATSTLLISGINLYAMAIIIEAMLGWSQIAAIIFSGVVVLVYTYLGGLKSAVYNEVMQFFVILAALIPLTVVGLRNIGGWEGLKTSLAATPGIGDLHLSTWQGTGIGNVTNPMGADWFTIVMGLGFVISFGYWTTNFTEVQRAFSAKDMTAARRTPIYACFPKLFVGFLVIIPGCIAAAVLSKQFASGALTYNESIPKLIQMYLPSGVLGIAVTGLMASFMAGMAANVSSFNTVFTYDLLQDYIKPGQPDSYYFKAGRVITIVGVFISVGTAFVASQFGNIMTYMQVLFGFFNSPLFAVFILGLFFKRITPAGATAGYVVGILAPFCVYLWYLKSVADGSPIFPTATSGTLYQAEISLASAMVVAIVVSLFTKPKPDSEIEGLTFATGGMKYFRYDIMEDAEAHDKGQVLDKAARTAAVEKERKDNHVTIFLGILALVISVIQYAIFF